MNEVEKEQIEASKEEVTDKQQRGKRRSSSQSRKRNNRARNANRLPDRWLNYDAVGRDIPGTRIVAFKTPLDATYFSGDNTTEDDRFEVQDLLHYAGVAGKTFGLVIDLTNTDRYYNSGLWRENGVEYIKIRCPGHEINRYEHLVQRFVGILKDFFQRNQNNEKIVGVHCTHGLNRTGYLICRYLMECHEWPASKAIKEFELYRGYAIERAAYIASLNELEAQKLESPESPEEKTTEEEVLILLDQNGNASELINSSSSNV